MRHGTPIAVLAVVACVIVGCGSVEPTPSSAVSSGPTALASGPAPSEGPIVSAAPSTTPEPTSGPTATPGPTAPPAAVALGADIRVGGPSATEPVLATHPTDPARLAVTYFRWTQGGSPLGPAIRISHDAGRSWRDAARTPWQGSGRVPGWHAALAWGPGPKRGPARLYWADMTKGRAGDQRMSLAWSDDEGRTWSTLHVERRTPAWVGGFPDITVDRDPASPGFGTVYATYNWPASSTAGPGIRLLASRDFGVSWQPLDIPRATSPAGYPAAWLIDARVRPAPDGSAYVAFFQADMRRWDDREIFRRGPGGNVGRAGYAVARIVFHRDTGRFDRGPTTMPATLPLNAWSAYAASTPGTDDNLVDPTWSLSLEVDRSTGRVLLAVGDVRTRPGGAPRGEIRVGRSDDRGRTWAWTPVPPLAPHDGLPQSAYRPNLVADGGRVVLFERAMTDVPVGTSVARHIPTTVMAVTTSSDGGATFAVPTEIPGTRWTAAAMTPATNGPGLRERAALMADGRVAYAWADARLGTSGGGFATGKAAIFAIVARVPPG